MEIKITERGWGGHYCCASHCLFRRNTLVESGNTRIVVSTVGAYEEDGKIKAIGIGRYYETMAFHALWDDPYWDADVQREVEFDSNWSIEIVNHESDMAANEMHEAVVAEIAGKITTGVIK